MFSCEFCEIPKSIFSYRTPPLAASVQRTFRRRPGHVQFTSFDQGDGEQHWPTVIGGCKTLK